MANSDDIDVRSHQLPDCVQILLYACDVKSVVLTKGIDKTG